MKKHAKILTLLAAVALVMSMTVVALAAAVPASAAGRGQSIVAQTAETPATYGCNGMGQRACYTLMWNEDGTFVSKEVFDERFDAAVEDGYFLAADKDYFLEMYDYCSEMVLNGLCGRANGTGCGAGGGRGMGGCGR